MELRKVQLTGGSSITVTLPKNWVERSSIKPGDVVGCAEQPDGSLSVFPHIKGERALQKYEVEVDDAERDFLFRKIIAAYLMGYDSIKINSRRPMTAELRQVVRHAVRRIMGLEIVEEQVTSITLQDFLDPKEFHLEKAVRRMGILCQAMQEEAMAALLDPKQDHSRSSEDRDDEVDRLFWLVNKQYHAVLRDANYAAKLGVNASQGLNFLLVARLIERTADHADRIVRESSQLPAGAVTSAFLGRVEKQGRRAVELFQLAVQTLFKRDAKKANSIIDDVEKFLDSQKKLLREATELGGDTVAHLSYILESIARTAAYAADVSEVAINHVVASQ